MIIEYQLHFVLVVRKFFMLINGNLKETVFNYCARWSGVDDQETDCSIISMGAMSHIKKASTTRNGFYKKQCTGGKKCQFFGKFCQLTK